MYVILPPGEDNAGGLDYGPFLQDLMNERTVFPGLHKYAELQQHVVYRVILGEPEVEAGKQVLY